jgi:hypothetical protein
MKTTITIEADISDEQVEVLKSEITQLCEDIGINIDYSSDNYVHSISDSDIEKYLIKVGMRSHEFTYGDSVIFDNIEYFKRCCKIGLSAYKALLFLFDYLEGKVELVEECICTTNCLGCYHKDRKCKNL